MRAPGWHTNSQGTYSLSSTLVPQNPGLDKTREPYRLTFRITNSSYEQGDELRPKDQAVEGQRAEAFLHGPVFTRGLVRV